jgi:hypothetical protein
MKFFFDSQHMREIDSLDWKNKNNIIIRQPHHLARARDAQKTKQKNG